MHPNDIKRIAIAATVAVVAAFAMRPGVAKAEQHVVCPMMVDSKHVSVDAPIGWQGIYGPTGVRTLEGAQAIFTTTDSLRDAWGELRDPPTARQKGGAVIQVTYPLPDKPEFTKWVICHYGESVYQALKLAPATTACTVTSRREIDPHTKKPIYRVVSVSCQ